MGARNSVESLVHYVDGALIALLGPRQHEPTWVSDLQHARHSYTDLQFEPTNEIQALRTVLQAQRCEIQLLKNRLKVALECPADPNEEFDAPNLPPEILSQIFNQIDTRSLLACRGVCTSWKNSIDNSPDLMRKLSFLIIHPRSSQLDLTCLTNIVPRVRAITFNRVLRRTDEQLRDLFTAIALTLESVTFNFDADWNYDFDLSIDGCLLPSGQDAQQRVTSSVFQHCYKLKELVILSRQKKFLSGVSLINITSLTMNVLGDSSERIPSNSIVHEMPKLSTITLLFARDALADHEENGETYKVILNYVCDHMTKYPGVLKKITLKESNSDYVFERLIAKSPELFLLAGKHSVVVCTEIPFDLDCLVEYEQTGQLAVNLKNCAAITNGVYSDSDSPLIDLCVNLEEIKLYLNEDTTPETISILWRLKKLSRLTLHDDCDGPILEGLFAAGLPNIRSLSIINVEVFTSLALLHLYFPNLVELCLYKTKTRVPEDFFLSLATLQKLTSLGLIELSGWTDAMFLFSTNSGIPAIATMANLKELTLCECVEYDMTDRSLNGIVQINTLETLTLLNCQGFTEVGYKAITDWRLKKRRTVEHGRLLKGLTFTC